MERKDLIEAAWGLLEENACRLDGEPVGVLAADDDTFDTVNYNQIFVRDQALVALAQLLHGRFDMTRSFLSLVADLQYCEEHGGSFNPPRGAMPVSFAVKDNRAEPDHGQHAIARVAPIDSNFWWLLVLYAYGRTSGDQAFIASDPIQKAVRQCLDLVLAQQLTLVPLIFVPEGSFMIDRRLGVYGHPLEIQALCHGALQCACALLTDGDHRCTEASERAAMLGEFINRHYWMDRDSINEINQFSVEGYGGDVDNPLNIQPEDLPRWAVRWLQPGLGYLAGNVGPGRLDGRLFTNGNLWAAALGLLDKERAGALLSLLDEHWDTLAARMPLKLVYPAVWGRDWILMTGRDPKNAPWSYHNGGSWPCLVGVLALAAARVGRCDLVERALATVEPRLAADDWQEYYEGEGGDLIGRRSRRHQSWTAAGYLIATAVCNRPSAADELGLPIGNDPEQVTTP